jgi:Predicted redox protein, regulator of disulfide bond formation
MQKQVGSMSNRAHEAGEQGVDFFLDITAEICPLTFVRTKLLIERMAPGQTADILLKGAEPVSNVPRAVAHLGHEILGLIAWPSDAQPTGMFRLRIRKQP